MKSRALFEGMLISFDFFDTLIARPFLSQESLLMSIAASQHDSILGEVGVERIFAARVTSEAAVRQRNISNEATLTEIYAELAERLKLNDDPVESLIQVEEEIELNYAVPIACNIARFAELKSLGHRILILSDTYHRREFIATVLRKSCDLVVGGEEIFVSGAMDCSKRRGTMYRRVAEVVDASPANWTHFGDDPWSDVFQARREGLRAVQLTSGRNIEFEARVRDATSNDVSRSSAFLFASASRCARVRTAGSAQPHGDVTRSAGVLSCVFVLWLLKKAEDEGLDALFFMERDCGVLYEVARQFERHVSKPPTLHRIFGGRAIFNSRRFDAAQTDDPGSEVHPKTDAERYLRQVGAFQAQRPGFVDVGWRGTVASSIDDAFERAGHALPTHLFLALDSDASFYTDGRSHAFGFDGRLRSKRSKHHGPLEAVLKSPLPPAVGIRLGGNSVELVFGREPSVESRAISIGVHREICSVASAAVQFFSKSIRSLDVAAIEAEGPFVYELFNGYVSNPCASEARILGRIEHSGSADDGSFLASPLPLRKVVLPHHMLDTSWFEGSIALSAWHVRLLYSLRVRLMTLKRRLLPIGLSAWAWKWRAWSVRRLGPAGRSESGE